MPITIVPYSLYTWLMYSRKVGGGGIIVKMSPKEAQLSNVNYSHACCKQLLSINFIELCLKYTQNVLMSIVLSERCPPLRGCRHQR